MLIICAGMMRSGSTLQYNISREVLAETGKLVAEGFLSLSDIGSNPGKIRKWADDDSLHLFKTHEVTDEFLELAVAGRANLLYCHRDLRDAAASAKVIFEKEGKDLILAVEEAADTFVVVFDFRKTYPDAVLVQSYPLLRDRLDTAVRQIAEYLGVSLSEPRESEIVSALNAEAVRKRLKSSGAWYSTRLGQPALRCARRLQLKKYLLALGFRPGFLKRVRESMEYGDREGLFHSGHISRDQGASGKFQDILTPDELAIIERDYSELCDCANP